MKSIYCPHLQETFDKKGMVWLKDIGFNVSLTEEQNLVLCKKCGEMVVIQSLTRAASGYKIR